jgi:uncharacterized membrane protein YdjX (TVP38/TMEM64 family)
MSPFTKFTLARVGLFVAFLAALYPFRLEPLLTLVIAAVGSSVVAFFILRRWRDQFAEQLSAHSQKRVAEKERLRAALAGEDSESAS